LWFLPSTRFPTLAPPHTCRSTHRSPLPSAAFTYARGYAPFACRTYAHRTFWTGYARLGYPILRYTTTYGSWTVLYLLHAPGSRHAHSFRLRTTPHVAGMYAYSSYRLLCVPSLPWFHAFSFFPVRCRSHRALRTTYLPAYYTPLHCARALYTAPLLPPSSTPHATLHAAPPHTTCLPALPLVTRTFWFSYRLSAVATGYRLYGSTHMVTTPTWTVRLVARLLDVGYTVVVLPQHTTRFTFPFPAWLLVHHTPRGCRARFIHAFYLVLPPPYLPGFTAAARTPPYSPAVLRLPGPFTRCGAAALVLPYLVWFLRCYGSRTLLPSPYLRTLRGCAFPHTHSSYRYVWTVVVYTTPHRALRLRTRTTYTHLRCGLHAYAAACRLDGGLFTAPHCAPATAYAVTRTCLYAPYGSTVLPVLSVCVACRVVLGGWF